MGRPHAGSGSGFSFHLRRLRPRDRIVRPRRSTGRTVSVRETSVESYREIANSLGDRQAEVFRSLALVGDGSTSNEVFRQLKGYQTIAQANISARLNELRRMGVVEEHGEKVCPVTGKKAIAWAITGAMPVRLEHRESKLDRVRTALAVYGKHKADCFTNTKKDNAPTAEFRFCTCGLSEALAL